GIDTGPVLLRHDAIRDNIAFPVGNIVELHHLVFHDSRNRGYLLCDEAPVPFLAGDLFILPPVTILVAIPAVFRGMERKDRLPVLEPVEGLDRVPVMKVQDIESLFWVRLLKLINHLVAHILAVLHGIISLGLAVMVGNTVDLLVLHPPAGEEMHVMILCKGLCKPCGCTRKPPDALGIERLPAEECYVK